MLHNFDIDVPAGMACRVSLDYTPDNDYGKDLAHVEIPEGYELDGDSLEEAFRYLQPGDLYICALIEHHLDFFGACVGTAQEDDEEYERVVVRRKVENVLVIEYTLDANDIAELAECENSFEVEQYAYEVLIPREARAEERDAA